MANNLFYLDIKSPDAQPVKLTRTLYGTLRKNHALDRVRVYSTNTKYIDALPESIPHFASRDTTRTALAAITMGHTCILDEVKNPTIGMDSNTAEKFKL